MIRDDILEAAALAESPEDKAAVIRECLEAAALRTLHDSGAFQSICAIGDTAARFGLGEMQRVQNLEFALFRKVGYSPEKWLFKIQRYFRFMGLKPRTAFARKGQIHSGWIKVTGLLAEAGLSVSDQDVISFGITIDARAPNGVQITDTADSVAIDSENCPAALVKVADEFFVIRYRSN